MLLLAAFGLAYVILDSSLLEPLRRRWWPEADCYFCVGFWCGALLFVLKQLAGWTGAPWPVIMELVETGLAACAVSGWLASRMIVFEKEEDDAQDIHRGGNDLRPGPGEGRQP